MALTPTVVTRTDDDAGDVFLMFLDGSSRLSQGVALVEALLGNPMGVTGSPMVAALIPGTTLDSSTPVEVAIATDGFATPVTNYVPLTPGSAEVSAIISASPTDLLELRVF